MASVNKVILIGNLGRDPEMKYLPSGDPVANFSIATTESWKDRSGQKQERTEWHTVEVFGKLAEIVRDYCTKGKQVYLEGSITYQEWTDREGAKRQRTKIKLSGPNAKLVLLGGGQRSSGAPAQQQAPPDDIPVSDDDDVPF